MWAELGPAYYVVSLPRRVQSIGLPSQKHGFRSLHWELFFVSDTPTLLFGSLLDALVKMLLFLISPNGPIFFPSGGWWDRRFWPILAMSVVPPSPIFFVLNKPPAHSYPSLFWLLLKFFFGRIIWLVEASG
jgi:hypothetical protein